ncbi:hypothetical protein OBBRIDRAFT_741057 [Obba rivulosa]|uniref:Uncharacterized protein n=1 Tax=Obba rivulosa TaxID=1052685 RepID=A0A8E2DJH6_9APHY|nr:hypothetical protein OBBRIDRAFT_741057 [Obba rivulosa]
MFIYGQGESNDNLVTNEQNILAFILKWTLNYEQDWVFSIIVYYTMRPSRLKISTYDEILLMYLGDVKGTDKSTVINAFRDFFVSHGETQ